MSGFMKGLSGFVLLAGAALVARVFISVAFIGAAVGTALPASDLQRLVSVSLSGLGTWVQGLGPAPRYESISVLDVSELAARRNARTVQRTAGGALIIPVGH